MTQERVEMYPVRPSLQAEAGFEKVAPIELSEEEKKQLEDYDAQIYEKYKDAKDSDVEKHVIYPEAFTTEEGQRLFSMIYMDTSIWQKTRQILKEQKLSDNDSKRAYNALFDDLQKNSQEGEEISYENFNNFLRSKGYEGEDHHFSLEPNSTVEGNEDSVIKAFNSVDMRQIPKDIRAAVSGYSSQFAKDKFKEAFRTKRGEVSQDDIPNRIGKVVSPAKLRDRIRDMREVKKWLKEERRKLAESGGNENIDEAKMLLLNLYQRSVNMRIANMYEYVRLAAEGPITPHKSIREAAEEVHGFSHRKGEKVNAARSMERIDHFLKGVGLEVDEDGLFQTTPDKLAEYVLQRVEETSETNEEYEKYNAIKINEQQMKTIAERVLHAYGVDEGDEKWEVVFSKSKKTFSISSENKRFYIPESYQKGLIDALAIISHEIEGHVLRSINKDAPSNMKITGYVHGRSNIFSEAAGMAVESKSKQEMVGVPRLAKPYYYLTIKEKERGGDFANCVRVNFESRAQRDHGMSLQEAIDSDEFDKMFSTAYSSTLRIFRGNTPLHDTSGYVATSDQLDYIEQEMVGDALMSEEARELGLDNLLFVKGMDIYSLYEMQRLGLLNFDDVKKPQMVVAREIWPDIKAKIDAGEQDFI